MHRFTGKNTESRLNHENVSLNMVDTVHSHGVQYPPREAVNMEKSNMKNIVDRLTEGLLKVCEIVSVTLMVILVTCTVLQVFCRFILNNALVWSEEVSRFAGIWMVVLSTAIAIHKRSHMTIDIVTGKFSLKGQNICRTVADFIIMLVCVCMIRFGAVMITMFAGTPAPATHLSMGIVYAGVIVGWVCSLLIALVTFVKSFTEMIRGVKIREEG